MSAPSLQAIASALGGRVRGDKVAAPYPGKKKTDRSLVVWINDGDINVHPHRDGFGPAPLSHQEIEAYQSAHKEQLRPFEIEIIRALDREYLKATASKLETANDMPVSMRPMSPALFDAVLNHS